MTAAKKTTAPRKTAAKKAPAKKTATAAPALTPAQKAARTRAENKRKNTADKVAPQVQPTQQSHPGPVTAIKHLHCETLSYPTAGIRDALTQGTWNAGLDCTLCQAYRPLEEFELVREPGA